MKRLDFIIANSGAASRSEAKLMIQRGRVSVNGKVITDPSARFAADVSIAVDGKEISASVKVYCVINKPAGYICAADDENSVLKLIKEPLYRKDIFTVGRLDKDTTGLLLITNDGDFAHRITSPKKKIPKTYSATVARPVTEEDVCRFGNGIGGFAPAVLKPDGAEKALVTVTEGQFHEVKRLFAATGNEVLALKRISIGKLTLPPDLSEGQARDLTDAEKLLIFDI